MSARVDLAVDDSGIAVVTLRNPGRRNAFSRELAVSLVDALRRVAADPAVRAVVLCGADGDFCVGADLAAQPERRVITRADRDNDLRRLREATEASRILCDLPVPVVAHIEGGCAGAGLSLALAADLRISSPDARFNTAFLGVGLSGDMGSAWLLTRAIGNGRARYLMLTAEKLSADRALVLGLVDEVTPDHAPRVAELAARLAAHDSGAVAGAKANLRDAFLPWESYVAAETERMINSAHAAGAFRAPPLRG